MKTISSGALAHAVAVRSSYDRLHAAGKAISDACDHDSDADVIRAGHALVRAEKLHWHFLLANAERTGANPMFYLAQLNRYDASGVRRQFGDLANAERREGGSWRLECQFRA